jgi:hypothetical protein
VAVDDPDDLYGLPLDAFVPERDALAKRLRSEGRRGDAGEVKALRKPSVAAWGVNQAVRTQPKAARELWDSGDALIGAQEALLAGRGGAGDLRAAVERERSALGGLVEAARGLLTSAGRDLGESTIERVRETLHAAAVDRDAREQVAPGRVTREMAHAGLGGLEAAPEPAARPASAPAERRTRGGAAAPQAQRGHKEQERVAAQQAEHARRDQARRRTGAERALREATRAFERAERTAGRAAGQLERAQASADEAQAALDEATARRREAEDELERAREGGDS